MSADTISWILAAVPKNRARAIRSANRQPAAPQETNFSFGFRIARTLEPNKRYR
jgi:hypothetical protein